MIKILTIVGPTAVGKSRLALEAAERFGGELINADALQVYRGFDIGTAKPTAEERERVPHHLVDILDARESYSAAEFARRAHGAIREIAARGRLPIVVGGSGFYVRTLLEGISPIPEVDPAIRARLTSQLEREGLEPARRYLRLLDPELADRLEERDRQRTLRGVEVALGSGRRLSEWQRLPPSSEGRLEAVQLGLTLPRDILYDRISDRVSRMLDLGWLQEVKDLLSSGLEPDVPAFRAIGYRQLAQCVIGGGRLDLAAEEIILATRRFAKRQWTWFRKDRDVCWVSAARPDTGLARITELL